MSLGCNIKEIKHNAFKEVQSLVKTKTINMNSQGQITFDYSNSSKYKTKEAAYNVAVSTQNKIKKWATENVGEKFNEGWSSIVQGNTITLQYNFPSYVQKAYNRKFRILEERQKNEKTIREARQQHINDAVRAGIDPAEFQDNYMYFQYQDDLDSMMDPDTQYRQDNAVQNDFTTYYQHKVDLLKKLEEKLDSYKTLNKSNFGTEKYKKTTYKFQDTINKLKDEIENLDTSKLEIVFQDVLHEIQYLDKTLETTDTEIIANQDVINRIDFLHQMITGENLDGDLVNNQVWDGALYDNYDAVIVAGITKLSNKLKTKRQEIIKDLLNKDVIYQAHKENFTEEEVQSLFESMSDINILQELFLGINSNNDSIVATLLNTTFQTNVQKTKQFARPLNELIISLDKKLKDKNFDLDNFFEKDDTGVDTGNIIHKYTRKYFRKLYEYYELNKEFNGAKKAKKASAYSKKISWLRENTNVIDFRKIKLFKDIYGEEYNDFFNSDDAEMNKYESELRQSLGKMYDYHIEDLQKKLSEYENYKMNETTRNTRWTSRNLNSNSPWAFIQNYYSDNAFKQVTYDGGSGNTYFTFNNSRFIEFVPKQKIYNVNTNETEQTGYFNDKFNDIENDADAFSYWESIRDIYTKHINPTYASMGQNISSLSWAKFERSMLEEMSRSKGIKGFFKNAYNETIKIFRKLWYERGYYTEKTGIKSNYTDATNKEVGKLRKLLGLKNINEIQTLATKADIAYDSLEGLTQGLSDTDKSIVTTEFKRNLIDKIARKKVLENYSKDLTKTTLALSELATLHKGRQETQFIADMLSNYHKSIKKNNGKDRNRSNLKVQSWVNTNIYNERAVSRGNKEDGLGKESSQRFWKYYSDSEKDLLKILQSLKDGGVDRETNFSFTLEGIGYSKKGTGYFEIIEGTPSKISKETFENTMQQYFDAEISRLGVPLTPGGFGMGIMKTIINKALALNPISGIFNRSEGMFSNMIRDNMGDYWTRGNLRYAKRFLLLGNINKFAPDKLSLSSKKKAAQLNTLQKLLDELALFQDKKNELARKDKESKFDKWNNKFNIFQFAVDNPEFKNQGEIVLSMLMDVTIKDVNGKEFKFFDGTGFPAYKPGTLELRDEFKNEENQGWQDFAINDNNVNFNQFFVQKLKIEDTIKRTQGNYASLDSIKFLDNNWGKFLMLFMRWMPEHVNQRFGKRNVDIIQGKKKIIGRYRGILNNAGATGVFASFALGIGLGPYGAIAGATAAIVPFILKRVYGKYVYKETDVTDHLLDIGVTIGFMKEVLVQSINIPAKVLYSTKNLDEVVPNKRLTNSGLSDTELASLRGMAQETAVMITQLLMLILLKSLLWDEDDDKDDTRRQLHNFIDNQGNRSINSLLTWSNPKTFVDDNSKLAMLRYIGDVEKLIKSVKDYNGKSHGSLTDVTYNLSKVQPFVAIPNSVNKGLFKGEVPGLDKKEYQSSQWFDDYIKGEEWRSERTLKNKRSKFKEEYEELLRQQYEGKDVDEDKLDKVIDKKVRKRMNAYDVRKKKGETNIEALERIDFEKEIEEDKNR